MAVVLNFIKKHAEFFLLESVVLFLFLYVYAVFTIEDHAVCFRNFVVVGRSDYMAGRYVDGAYTNPDRLRDMGFFLIGPVEEQIIDWSGTDYIAWVPFWYTGDKDSLRHLRVRDVMNYKLHIEFGREDGCLLWFGYY